MYSTKLLLLAIPAISAIAQPIPTNKAFTGDDLEAATDAEINAHISYDRRSLQEARDSLEKTRQDFLKQEQDMRRAFGANSQQLKETREWHNQHLKVMDESLEKRGEFQRQKIAHLERFKLNRATRDAYQHETRELCAKKVSLLRKLKADAFAKGLSQAQWEQQAKGMGLNPSEDCPQ